MSSSITSIHPSLGRQILERNRRHARTCYPSIYPVNEATSFIRKLKACKLSIINRTDSPEIIIIQKAATLIFSTEKFYIDNQYTIFPHQSLNLECLSEHESFERKTSNVIRGGYIVLSLQNTFTEIFHGIELFCPKDNITLNVDIFSTDKKHVFLEIDTPSQTYLFENLSLDLADISSSSSDEEDQDPFMYHLESYFSFLSQKLWLQNAPHFAKQRGALNDIPHVLHTIFFGFDRGGMPAAFKKNLLSWLKRMPSLKRELWTYRPAWESDETYQDFVAWASHYDITIKNADLFLRKHLKRNSILYRAFKKFLSQKHYAPAGDILRALIMYFKGGIYSDLDVRAFADLSPLLDYYRLILGTEHSLIKWAGNAFSASCKKHPFYDFYLTYLQSHMYQFQDSCQFLERDSKLSVSSTLLLTGPIGFTTAFVSYCQQMPTTHFSSPQHPLYGCAIFPPPYFYPIKEGVRSFDVGKVAALSHMNAHTWLPNL